MAIALTGSEKEQQQKAARIKSDLEDFYGEDMVNSNDLAAAQQSLNEFLQKEASGRTFQNDAQALDYLRTRAVKEIMQQRPDVSQNVQELANYLGYNGDTWGGRANGNNTDWTAEAVLIYPTRTNNLKNRRQYTSIEEEITAMREEAFAATNHAPDRLGTGKKIDAALNERTTKTLQSQGIDMVEIQTRLRMLGYLKNPPGSPQEKSNDTSSLLSGTWDRNNQEALRSFIREPYRAKGQITTDLSDPDNARKVLDLLRQETDRRTEYDRTTRVKNGDNPIASVNDRAEDPKPIITIQTYLNMHGYSGKMPTGVWTRDDQYALRSYAQNNPGMPSSLRDQESFNLLATKMNNDLGAPAKQFASGFINAAPEQRNAPVSANAKAQTTEAGKTVPETTAAHAEPSRPVAAAPTPQTAKATFPPIKMEHQAYLEFLDCTGYETGVKGIDGKRGDYTNEQLKSFAEKYCGMQITTEDLNNNSAKMAELLTKLELTVQDPAIVAQRMAAMHEKAVANPVTANDDTRAIQYVLAANGVTVPKNGILSETETAYNNLMARFDSAAQPDNTRVARGGDTFGSKAKLGEGGALTGQEFNPATKPEQEARNNATTPALDPKNSPRLLPPNI